LNMYIDGDTDIDESLEGTYPLDITGIFSQFDATPPYDVGYQIIPRSVADLTWGASGIVDAAPAGMITEFSLYPNFPNPFNPSTTLQFDVPEYTDNLELSIYNITGEKIRSLYTGSMKKGRFTLKWDGTDDTHRLLPSGVYFALLRAAAFSQSIKMMLIK
ncbi:MAG: T9SS type A sorting domain-containing protein, partial [ANME-2 cluster archaeon]